MAINSEKEKPFLNDHIPTRCMVKGPIPLRSRQTKRSVGTSNYCKKIIAGKRNVFSHSPLYSALEYL